MKLSLSISFAFILSIVKSQSVSIDSIITRQSLEYTVSALAHDSMKGRYTALDETKNAAIFIANQFEKAGLTPLAGNDFYFSYYPLKFEYKDTTTLVDAINVLGAIQGNESADSLVIFCAHYDHVGIGKTDGTFSKDSVFNGANDNASGVALLIELAKYYAKEKNNKYTLLFIAFSGEELGLLGSAHTASHMNQSLIRAVINFDMVGRSLSNRAKTCMVIADNSKPLIKKLNAEIYPQKKFFIADKFPEEKLFYRSDHYSFNKVANKIFFTASSPTDRYYHTIDDEYKTINFDFLLLNAKNIAIACKIFLK